MNIPLLSLLVWTPIVGGIWVLLAGGKKIPDASRAVALTVSIVTFALSIPLYTWFELGEHQMQFAEQTQWIPAFGITYHLGVDGFSMPLILLTTFTTVLVVIAGSAVELEWAKAHCDAIIFAGVPGEAGGRAISRMLWGEVSPTGR